MKTTITLIVLLAITTSFNQSITPYQSTPAMQIDTTSTNILFFEDFNNNKNNWSVAENKNMRARIADGYYYLTAVGHAYGEATEVKIDTRKDFEIETRIKIESGKAEHKNYYSMLFWGREAMSSYYLTFAKDGFASVELCASRNQSSCITKKGSLQKTTLNPDDFNVYMVRKKGNTYFFFINGVQFYEMPFVPFFGDLTGFGAGRNVTLQIDYLKVTYL